MKVLVTGFDPFGGESINPAYEAVKMLPDEIAGAQIIKREIPTSFTRGTAEVVRQIELCQPDLVLNVGQAGGAAGLRVERVAINLADARIPDNDGAQPVDEPLVQDGAPAYFAKLPVKAMVCGVQAKGYNTWKFCGEQTHDRILAYAVELTGAANGTVQGNLYELDYQQHFQHIRDAALPVGANRLIYESGMREIGPKEHFNSRSDKYFGEFVRYEMQPRDPELLQAAIRQEQRSREPARPGDFKEHLAALHTGLIEAEAQRIAANMKRLAAPNSPDKNHFMVEVSPYFTKLASSRDTDQLLAMLPYKSLHLSSVKDRFGIYALVGKNENRDKGICKPRTSVRKQLSETKQAASPKKAAARSKQHEMEV